MELLFEQIRELLHKITETIYFFRKQNDYKAFESSKTVIDLLQVYLGSLQAQDAQEYLPVLSMAMDAMEERDGTKLADLYEEGILPLLYQMQQNLFETCTGGFWNAGRMCRINTSLAGQRQAIWC